VIILSKQELIISLRMRFKLFKSPNRIGDVIEYKNVEYLIIGIEQVRLIGSILEVRYTCQNLAIEHSFKPMVNLENDYVAIDVKVDIPKVVDGREKILGTDSNLVTIGSVFEKDSLYYRYHSFTDLVFDSMILNMQMLAEPVRPVTVESARNQLLSHKKQKTGLFLV